ncbi:MAG: homoserine dehydrogenase [Verrucomicrobiae bacterium]|nr:homoserine dehydrogenase [Verrucomicrobiae bacterium]
MLKHLRALESDRRRLKVGVIGCGAMGRGVALQVAQTPGMELAFIADLADEAISRTLTAAQTHGIPVNDVKNLPTLAEGQCLTTNDAAALLEADNALGLDVLVECTNSIAPAARYCLAAIARKAHVVLMNAEVDLALGQLLAHEAALNDVIVTSDAGDQHGVLARMIEEIEMWGFRIVQAGNIKGFLDRYQTAGGLAEEAAKRNLSPIQCCAYTDGTKLNIEMAVIANALDLSPFVVGMEGPACKDVREVMSLFDFDAYGDEGRVDYILGAEPGGGVYVVGHCDNPHQIPYLEYYKLGQPPYYLFYRPYHLCHLETPWAIAEACLFKRALLAPPASKKNDVYAFAKTDLPAGTRIGHAIGGDHLYGMIETTASASARGAVTMSELESEGGESPVLLRDVKKDQPLVAGDIQIPDSDLQRLLARQASIGNSAS